MNLDKALVDYTTIDESPFCVMFDMIGSDKGYTWHQYSRFYYSLMRPLRDCSFHFFELGIGSINPTIPSNMGPNGFPGASHNAWKGYFKNAHIYGADIDKDILVQSDRLSTFYCDQTDPNSIQDLWKNPELEDKEFTIIIDDGLHTPKANFRFFEHSIHKLAKGGIYIIEDINDEYYDMFSMFLEECKASYPDLDCRFIHIDTNNSKQPGDNNLFIAYKN